MIQKPESKLTKIILLVACAVLVLPTTGTAQITRSTASYPSISFYPAFTALHNGDFGRALDGFRASGRLGLRTADGAWVDSVCYRTMIGECYYRLGNLKSALEQYSAALQLFVLNRDWMTRVQFPNAISPYNRPIRPPVTWANGARPFAIGQIPDKFQILFGNLNNEIVLQQGGTFAPTEYRTINVHEIVRCTALALRRRYELLGPVGPYDPLTAQLLAAYDSRIGPPNHWSQAWINVQRGYALAAAGNFDEATRSFRASIVLAGRYDHPLTGTALLGLGQMALEQNQVAEATKLFIDASVAAAIFEQPELVEDAFVMASDAELSRPSEAALPLSLAMEWAKRGRYRHLHSTLSTLSAEHLAYVSNPGGAMKMLAQARQTLDRRAAMARPLEARFEYVGSQASYQQGNLVAAQSAMARSVNLQRTISPWLNQIALTDQLYRSRSGAMTPRAAGLVFEQLLREPTAPDWTMHPVDTFSYILSPSQSAYEHWFEIALDRGETEKALEIGDRMRRQRFYSQLPLGGRLVSFRWILGAPDESLEPLHIELRNDLLTRYPAMKQLVDQQREARSALAKLPWVDLDVEQNEQQKERAKQLENLVIQQEAVLGEIALRREYCPFVIPPIKSANEIQQSLQPNQVALVYQSTSKGLYAFMFSNDKYGGWNVAPAKRLRRDFAKLFKELGLTSDNAVVSVEQLQDPAWQDLGRQVIRELIDRGQFGFWNSFDELLIVPDGILWYVPFEALPTNEPSEDYAPLISKVRIRYLPTAGMICHTTSPRRRDPRTAVVTGKLFPRDDSNVALEQVADMQEIVSNLEILPSRLPGSSGLLRSIWDRLLVLDDIPQTRAGPLGWSPARIDQGKPGSSLKRWLTFPWGSPRQVLIPGFHTAAESGLKQSVTGNEMFLIAMTFLASGTDTVLLSRWRTGGASCYDLVREFLQEEAQGTPAEAWQRSVQILRETEFDPSLEPRVSFTKDATPISADHPFLWSGYLLIDVAGNRPDHQVLEQAGPAARRKLRAAQATP